MKSDGLWKGWRHRVTLLLTNRIIEMLRIHNVILYFMNFIELFLLSRTRQFTNVYRLNSLSAIFRKWPEDQEL